MRWTTTLTFVLPLSLVEAALQWHNASIAHVPSEWLYLLPQPFDSAIQYGWLNSTTTDNSTINIVLANANNSRIVSYSDEFTDLVGPNPTWATIQSPPNDPYGAYEGGAWIPETDEVWFGYNGFYYPYNQTITSFNLQNGTSRQVVTDPPISYPYGMYYWPRDGQVYVTEINTPTNPASVVAIDPTTLKVRGIFNSYQGLPLAPCDDITIARISGKDYIYATTFSVHSNIPKVPQQRYDTAVWRFNLDDKILQPVLDPSQIFAPNGIRVSPDQRKLYVTNTPLINADQLLELPTNTTKANSIFVYDLADDGAPVNGRLFALIRTGIANGIHIDNAGRVWTCEDDGIVVRSPAGVTLGLFNYAPFHPTLLSPPIANFALAGNRLVIGVDSYVVIYNISETLTSTGNLLTN